MSANYPLKQRRFYTGKSNDSKPKELLEKLFDSDDDGAITEFQVKTWRECTIRMMSLFIPNLLLKLKITPKILLKLNPLLNLKLKLKIVSTLELSLNVKNVMQNLKK